MKKNKKTVWLWLQLIALILIILAAASFIGKELKYQCDFTLSMVKYEGIVFLSAFAIGIIAHIISKCEIQYKPIPILMIPQFHDKRQNCVVCLINKTWNYWYYDNWQHANLMAFEMITVYKRQTRLYRQIECYVYDENCQPAVDIEPTTVIREYPITDPKIFENEHIR